MTGLCIISMLALTNSSTNLYYPVLKRNWQKAREARVQEILLNSASQKLSELRMSYSSLLTQYEVW